MAAGVGVGVAVAMVVGVGVGAGAGGGGRPSGRPAGRQWLLVLQQSNVPGLCCGTTAFSP